MRAARHDFFNLAQSSAYAAMFSLFPALIVAAAIFAALPESAPFRNQLGIFFESVLPEDVVPMLTGYFVANHRSALSARVMIFATIFGLSGASSVMATIMEGLRRAGDLPRGQWSFLERRARALLLIPISLIPLLLASVLVVWGRWITHWLAIHSVTEVRPAFYVMAFILRWVIALAGVVTLTATIYHLGTPVRRSWYRTLPGALAATGMWFLTTLVFGWYVTRFANYTVVYGSLGTGVALLIWLFIVFLSVLVGAAFNHEFDLRKT